MNLRLENVPRPAWARCRASPRLATPRARATARTRSGGGDPQQLSEVSLGNATRPVPSVQSPFPRPREPVSTPRRPPHAALLRRHRRGRLWPAARPAVRGLRATLTTSGADFAALHVRPKTRDMTTKADAASREAPVQIRNGHQPKSMPSCARSASLWGLKYASR
jgi:hypothetical protein